MKVGDIVRFKPPYFRSKTLASWTGCNINVLDGVTGAVVEFIPATHAKEYQRIRVLFAGKLAMWPMQYCEVINESR